jgi:hypothetical protein
MIITHGNVASFARPSATNVSVCGTFLLILAGDNDSMRTSEMSCVAAPPVRAAYVPSLVGDQQMWFPTETGEMWVIASVP